MTKKFAQYKQTKKESHTLKHTIRGHKTHVRLRRHKKGMSECRNENTLFLKNFSL